jgi:hypothetical protein
MNKVGAPIYKYSGLFLILGEDLDTFVDDLLLKR